MQAVAITAYGGSLDVLPLVTMPRVTSTDGAMFTEVHIKLRQGEDAEALRTTVEHAIETGAFYTTLASLSFPHSDITVTIVETDEGDVEHVDGPDGAPYASGYEGYITLRISDLPPIQFTPLFQLYLRSVGPPFTPMNPFTMDPLHPSSSLISPLILPVAVHAGCVLRCLWQQTSLIAGGGNRV